jgi:hypothetical protein
VSKMAEFQAAPAAVQADVRVALDQVSTHAIERLEQIGALGQTLLLLLKSPQFHDMPWLAAAQLDALIFLVTDGIADIDATASRFVARRDRQNVRDMLANSRQPPGLAAQSAVLQT